MVLRGLTDTECARKLAKTGASTAPKLIDAMSHDAAVLKQKKHITPKSFTFWNALEVLSNIRVVLRRGSCATDI
jgi:hypothetical protein